MKERVLPFLREIEKVCHVILEDRQLKENRLIATRLGVENILTICGLAMEEIKKGHEEKK